MKKKHGLGKGLGALIPEEPIENKEINKIPLNLIRPNKEQPRKAFDEDKIVQLSESIKEHGIIQPLVLKKEDDIYIIIAGERRWRAAKFAGIAEVPAVIMDLDNKQVLEISLIENIQREDLNPIEEAQAYSKLITEFNLTQEDLSKRIGKSRTAVTNCLRLLNLDERVQDYIIDGVISEGHGRTLLSIKDKDIQYKMAQRIIDDKLSVREIERIIGHLNVKSDNKRNIEKNPYIKNVEVKLETFFDTKVNINHKKNKGKIEIEYYSQEDLQRILDLFNM